MKRKPTDFRITATSEKQTWRVWMPDGLTYEIVHASYGETRGHRTHYWYVIGGGYNRSHHCEPDGATYKRVMAAFRKHTQADAASI